jgi:alkylated DNA repair dioxygenase AlkB
MIRVFEKDKGSTAFLDKGSFPKYKLLEQCVFEVDPLLEERPEIYVYNKMCKQQRYIGFFSDESVGYKYSNKLMASKPLSPKTTELIQTVNTLLGTEFNGILVNKYMDGNDYIGAHSDSEIGLDARGGVVALSFGAERTFRIRCKHTKKILHEEQTTNGSILQMGGAFQKLYTHEIPVQKKIKEARTSITFRKHTK